MSGEPSRVAARDSVPESGNADLSGAIPNEFTRTCAVSQIAVPATQPVMVSTAAVETGDGAV